MSSSETDKVNVLLTWCYDLHKLLTESPLFARNVVLPNELPKELYGNVKFTNPAIEAQIRTVKATFIKENLSEFNFSDPRVQPTLTPYAKAIVLLSNWRNVIENQVADCFPPQYKRLASPAIRPPGSHEVLWFMEPIDKLIRGDTEIIAQPTKDATAEEVLKALRVALVHLAAAHAEILSNVANNLNIVALMQAECQPPPMDAAPSPSPSLTALMPALTEKLLTTPATPEEKKILGLPDSATVSTAGNVILIFSCTVQSPAVDSGAFPELIKHQLATKDYQAVVKNLRAGDVAEVRKIIGEQMAIKAREDYFETLANTCSALMSKTDARLASECIFDTMLTIGPYISNEENAYLVSRLMTESFEASKARDTLEHVKQSGWKSHAVGSAFSKHDQVPIHQKIKLLCAPANKIPELYASTFKPKTVNTTASVSDNGQNRGDGPQNGRNGSGARYNRNFAGRDQRGHFSTFGQAPSYGGYSAPRQQQQGPGAPNEWRPHPRAPGADLASYRPGPPQGLQGRYAPRPDAMPPSANVNNMNYSHEDMGAVSMGPAVHDQFYGQQGFAGRPFQHYENKFPEQYQRLKQNREGVRAFCVVTRPLSSIYIRKRTPLSPSIKRHHRSMCSATP